MIFSPTCKVITQKKAVLTLSLVSNAPPPFFKWIAETIGVELVLREIFNYFKIFILISGSYL